MILPRPAGIRLAGLLLTAALLSPSPARAFGKNKVIVDDFKWRVLSTEHFDIYHTPEAEPLLPRAAVLLEKAYRRVTSSLDVEIKQRTPFFLHVNHNQFEQNNVAEAGEGTGGVTEAFKGRFVVFNNGTEFWLEHVITHEFVHVAEFEVLYGGFWRSARLLKSPLYPLWFMEGLAEYHVGDLDREEEDLYIRDAATTDSLYSLAQLHGFAHLKPHEVTLGYKQGAAAVRFLAEEYGRENVPQLLKLLRDRFEVPSIVADLTGQDFGSFDWRYREYLEDFYAADAAGREEPSAYGERLTPKDILPVFNTNPVLSPDGKTVAYVSDRGGANEVVLYDRATRRHRAAAGRQWRKIEHLHAEGRALSFSPDGRWLAFAGEKEQRDYLYLYDLKRDRLRRVRLPVEQVRSPAFHPAGDRLVVAGMKGGLNDLYEVNLRGKLLRRLTDTPADEGDPVYSPDGRRLVFSREVLVPGLDSNRADGLEETLTPERDLYGLDPETLATFRLTDLKGDEITPAFTPDGRAVLFTGDADGVHDLYRLDLAEGEVRRLTRVAAGNFAPFVGGDGTLLFSSYRRRSQEIYAADRSLWDPAVSTRAERVAGLQPSRENWGTAGGPRKDDALPPPFAAAPQDRRLFAGADGPYRFRASTDLFFPLFFYSSTDGLFLATYWQASEYLGNHGLQTQLQYSSGNDFLDYQFQYSYKRFRPQFFVSAGGQNFFRDFSETELRRESEQLVGVSYPLDRFDRLEWVIGTVYRADKFEKFPAFDVEERENLTGLTFYRDTTTGRYLAVTSGDRFRVHYQVSRPVFGGDRNYKSHVFEWHRFRPTGRESAVALRSMLGVSAGPSPQLFRLGGVDRLRGYSRNDTASQAARFLMTNLEWRVPLKYTDYLTWFIFPDFAIKGFYATLFTDTGYAWRRGRELNDLKATRALNSVGAGVRAPVFVLQTYLTTVSIDVAKRTDRDDWAWYLSLGPEF